MLVFADGRIAWAAVQQFTAVRGGDGRPSQDKIRREYRYTLAKTVTVVPVSAIRRHAHLYHDCTVIGEVACGLVRRRNGQEEWRHMLPKSKTQRYLFNSHYRSGDGLNDVY